MKKLVLLLVLPLTFFLCTVSAKPHHLIPPPQTGDKEIFAGFKDMDKTYPGPLPWQKNIAFQKTIRNNATPVLMAAYKASLPEPLPGEAYNIGLAADRLAGTVVQPGEIFSQNRALGPYTEYRGYRAGPTYAGNQLITTVGGGVCKVASLLYNVATFSNVPVIMRTPHSMTVPYVPPGQDATVYYGVKDFRFLNDTGGPIVIWSQKKGDTLYMAMYGRKKPPQITWHHQIINRTGYQTEKHYNPSLQPGEVKVVLPGQNGLAVKSWVTIKAPGSQVTVKEKGTSYYNPGPRIIEYGLQ